MNSRRNEFVEHVLELCDGLGTVSAKRMFGGWGVYLDGVMFALIADDTLYLKTDEISRPAFIERGLEPFTFVQRGKTRTTRYYRAPEETLEDGEQMADWVRHAWEAARRS